MTIGHEIVINRSREEVWRTFDNPENLSKWQSTFKGFERLSGEPGSPGSVSRLTYEENGRRIVLTETIVSRREFEELSAEYASGPSVNRISNRFASIDGGRTVWVMECEFLFMGFFFKLLSPLLKIMIRHRFISDMEQFRQLAERD